MKYRRTSLEVDWTAWMGEGDENDDTEYSGTEYIKVNKKEFEKMGILEQLNFLENELFRLEVYEVGTTHLTIDDWYYI